MPQTKHAMMAILAIALLTPFSTTATPITDDCTEEVLEDATFETCRFSASSGLDLNGILEDLQGGDPFEMQTKCYDFGLYCALAGADMHEEGVNNAPNIIVHMTTGGGQNNFPSHFGQEIRVDVRTTLGNRATTIGPGEGILYTWTNIGTGSCQYDELRAKSEVYPVGLPSPGGIIDLSDPLPVSAWTPMRAQVIDSDCNKV